MSSWDETVTFIIVATAAYYLIQTIYKTIRDASKGGCGCCSACSACSHCNIKKPVAIKSRLS